MSLYLIEGNHMYIHGDGTWELKSSGKRFNVRAEVIVAIADRVNPESLHVAQDVFNVLKDCKYSISRSGTSITVWPTGREKWDRKLDASEVVRPLLPGLSRHVFVVFCSARWAEISRISREMTEVPASREHRGNGHPKHLG